MAGMDGQSKDCHSKDCQAPATRPRSECAFTSFNCTLQECMMYRLLYTQASPSAAVTMPPLPQSRAPAVMCSDQLQRRSAPDPAEPPHPAARPRPHQPPSHRRTSVRRCTRCMAACSFCVTGPGAEGRRSSHAVMVAAAAGASSGVTAGQVNSATGWMPFTLHRQQGGAGGGG